jgi:hypothetical protein
MGTSIGQQESRLGSPEFLQRAIGLLEPSQAVTAMIAQEGKSTARDKLLNDRIVAMIRAGASGEAKTAMSAYLQKYPNATAEQIAAYQRSLSPTMGGEGKPVNMPQWYDDLGVSTLGSKYHTPEGQRKFADFIQTPAGQLLKEKAQKKYVELNTPPIYTFPQTNQGIVPGNVRTGEMGPPSGYGKPMPENTIVAQQQIGTLYEILDKVSKTYNANYVGPIYGRAGQIESEWINVPKDQASFYAYNAQINNTLVYLLSGKQINEEEYKRLKKQMPSPELPQNTYEARMENFRTTLDSIIAERAKNMGAYKPTNPTAPTGGTTIRYDASGKRIQ